MGLSPGPTAYLVSVGNELLIGKVVNTNLAWLGRKLTGLGYRVEAALIVPDELDLIAWAFSTAVERGAKVVVSTGGLGPTFDDKTAEGLGESDEC
jgi:molybdopterin-biosynthesis enzyme MoeA-like protein